MRRVARRYGRSGMGAVEMLLARAHRFDLVAVDVTVALLLGVVFVVQEASVARPGVVSLLAGSACAATVAWRRRDPAVTTVTAAVCVGVLVWSGGSTDLVPIVLVLDVYVLGRRSAEHGWSPVEVLMLVLAIPALAFVPGNSRVVDFVAVWAFFVAVPFVAGRVIGCRGSRPAICGPRPTGSSASSANALGGRSATSAYVSRVSCTTWSRIASA